MLRDMEENQENSENLALTQSVPVRKDEANEILSQTQSENVLVKEKNNALDNNLQSSKSTIRERNSVMFNNEMLSDVHFRVGIGKNEQRIPAHKYVLAIGSSVFFAMFNGNLAEQKDEIHIPDVEPVAFLTLLRYLYCDIVSLEPDTVLATLYASKKYIVPSLAQSCVDYLETSLSHKNACILLSQSNLFEESELTRRCWEVIDAQAELSLRADSFTDVDELTLEAVLSRETLNVKETTVFIAAHNWSVAQCKRCGIEENLENKRKVLGKILYLIRIPTMSLQREKDVQYFLNKPCVTALLRHWHLYDNFSCLAENLKQFRAKQVVETCTFKQEFADGPAKSGILTKEEIIDVFMWYSAAEKPQLKFNIEPRKGLVPNFCHRFQSTAYRSNQWRYRGRCDSIRFMAEKRIFVAGFGLYGSSTGAANYSARIKLLLNGRLLAEEIASFFSDGSSKTFPVWFHHPIQCEANEFYTASVVLDGNELSYFGQEGMAEVECDDVIIQFQCSCDSTNGTGVQGGQIPELIFYKGAS